MVLAHIGGDKCIATGHFPELFHQKLRLDGAGTAIVGEAVATAPFLDLLPPGGERFLVD